ncbi:uncharacterized protein LOC123227520 isoform X7 [Mangifera indica]|uniref:uncharacterized protein LOC123227520 isoform X7 n=1 Tax=Mangifera indica TaxID=29780 RepID=UPI001CFABE67|nr:uncharacterized protein LOC123227520 isoform X7 [Mangifera indica]
MTSSVFDKHFGRIIHSWQSGIVISTRGYESSQLFEGIGPRLLISQTFNLTERLSSQPKIRENLNQMFLQCIKHWCGIYCLHVFQDSWRFNRMGQNVVINLSMPSDIEEHKSLQTMFLGNNGLSGTIPQQRAVYLKNMNLVASNFMFDSSNICILPGLNCLQRNFPCNKNAPHYSSFAI